MVQLLNKIIEAEDHVEREDHTDEMLNAIEDLVIISYLKGRQNGQALGPNKYSEDEEYGGEEE